MALTVKVSFLGVRTFGSQVLQTEKNTQPHKRTLQCVPGQQTLTEIATFQWETPNESLLSPSSSAKIFSLSALTASLSLAQAGEISSATIKRKDVMYSIHPFTKLANPWPSDRLEQEMRKV